MKFFKNIFMIIIVICMFFPLQTAIASPVHDQLKASIDQIMDILKDPALKGENKTRERRKALRKIINERFSFAKMSQLTLARHWRKRSKEEKKVFIKLFGQLLEDTYISKIESYTNEKIMYVKEYVKKKKAQINTKIITQTIEIPIDYRLYHAKNGAWMVYDMVIEGVSLVGNYRSQFDQILQKDSYEKLLEDLKKKIDS